MRKRILLSSMAAAHNGRNASAKKTSTMFKSAASSAVPVVLKQDMTERL